MISPIAIEMIAKEREAHLLRETESIRLANAAKVAEPRLWPRLFSAIGDAFIAAGQWLKARALGNMRIGMEPCPTCCEKSCA